MAEGPPCGNASDPATRALVESVRAIGEQYARLVEAAYPSASARRASGPQQEWLALVRSLTAQTAAPVAQLEAFVAGLQGHREQIRALQAQLSAFEQQLSILERSLFPLLEWGRQAVAMQQSVLGDQPRP